VSFTAISSSILKDAVKTNLQAPVCSELIKDDIHERLEKGAVLAMVQGVHHRLSTSQD
jgi:hypothetical protein